MHFKNKMCCLRILKLDYIIEKKTIVLKTKTRRFLKSVGTVYNI